MLSKNISFIDSSQVCRNLANLHKFLYSSEKTMKSYLTLFHTRGGDGAHQILGRLNSCSESSSNTKFGKFSLNLMRNLVMMTNFQNRLVA